MPLSGRPNPDWDRSALQLNAGSLTPLRSGDQRFSRNVTMGYSNAWICLEEAGWTTAQSIDLWPDELWRACFDQ